MVHIYLKLHVIKMVIYLHQKWHLNNIPEKATYVNNCMWDELYPFNKIVLFWLLYSVGTS